MTTTIYLRTSTEEQHPENQLKDCKSLISNEPYEVLEERQSAWRDKERPIFESIRQRIRVGSIKSLVVWDWDRLYRNRKKLREFFEFCKVYGCEIHSFRQKFFEDFYKIPKPFDEIMQDLFLNLLGWMAEDESQKKSERVKIAFQNHKGNWGRPLKIKNNLKEEVLKLKEQGLSLREIAQSVWYYDKNRNQKFISKSAVHKILSERNKEK
jgi:DNA invertase Pin-like site-specific DNA recombinase